MIDQKSIWDTDRLLGLLNEKRNSDLQREHQLCFEDGGFLNLSINSE